MLSDFLRKEINELIPYCPDTPPYKIKLDIMENPYPIPKKVKNKIKNLIERIEFNRYPDPLASRLKGAISKYTGLPSDMILVGNGSDEIILYLLLAFSGRVIFPIPTFPIYEIIGKMMGYETIGIPLLNNFELDSKKIIESATGKSIIFLAWPNNPTGNCFEISKIEEIIKKTNAIVIIDEAYYEFSKKTLVPLLYSYERLAIIRTFSKAFGLAGIRCGYILANREFIDCIEKVKLPYNLNCLSQEIAAICLEEWDVFNKNIEKIISERERLYKKLSRIEKIKVFPSLGNFLFFREEEPKKVYSFLLNKGILIKPIADGLRVTIGNHKENEAFIKAMYLFYNKK